MGETDLLMLLYIIFPELKYDYLPLLPLAFQGSGHDNGFGVTERIPTTPQAIAEGRP